MGQEFAVPWLPSHLIPHMLETFHSSFFACHSGQDKVMSLLYRNLYWPNQQKTVAEFIASCVECKKGKPMTHRTMSPRQPFPPVEQPFDRVVSDICGPLNPTASTPSYRYVVIFVCYRTRFLILAPAQTQQAQEIAKVMTHALIFAHGIPRSFLTDQGSTYTSKLFANVCKLLQINQLFTTPYHKSSGLGERGLRTIQGMLRALMASNPHEWHELLPAIAFSYNSAYQASLHASPYFLLYGRTPKNLVFQKTPPPVYNDELPYDELLPHYLNRANILADAFLSKSYGIQRTELPRRIQSNWKWEISFWWSGRHFRHT